jgi:hypothetical protein
MCEVMKQKGRFYVSRFMVIFADASTPMPPNKKNGVSTTFIIINNVSYLADDSMCVSVHSIL